MSEVVETSEDGPGVLLVRMCDRRYKNGFSPALVDGLLQAFDHVRTAPHLRVVVLTGYDTYFSSGGTREALLALHEGTSVFTDVDLYRTALDCELPVLSAMQGHAIGGGLALGLFSDLAVLSRESYYSANFMRYGFTPGMGATLIIPRRLGEALGHEMLLTARNYRGADLAARGIAHQVLPRNEVLPHTLRLAREIADKPRPALRMLKQHLSKAIRAELPTVLDEELAMHSATLGDPEVRRRVETRWGR